MKNTIALQTNQTTQKIQSSCIITFKGNEVVLTNKKRLSFELFFGEVIHQVINFFSKVTKLFKGLKIRKGNFEMKNHKEDKYMEEANKNCRQCFDSIGPSNYWESFRLQKEMQSAQNYFSGK